MKTFTIFLCAILLFFSFCTKNMSGDENSGSNKIRVILDTDANNELDDQHAIAYMLFNSHIFEVEGITVNRTRNGGNIDKHYEEAERIVKLCALHPQIKIYKGASGTYDEIISNIHESSFDGSEAVDFIIKRAKAQDERKLVLLPVGKLTNIALALKKDPSIIPNVRIVWLGTNYPDPGEYNFDNDISALDPILESNVEFEMVMVRYGKPSGTDAVKAYLKDFRQKMPGKGPHISEAVTGRHGGTFTCFGDYSVDLFEKFRGNPESRPLFDMAAVAIVKNPDWADRVVINAPKFIDGKWLEQPEKPRKIVIWENFKKEAIMKDFYHTMENYHLPKFSKEKIMLKNIKIKTIIIMFAFVSLYLATAPVSQAQPKIIIDTDFCLDQDDLGAMATLHALADNGECEILAVIYDEEKSNAADALDVVNTWYQRPTLPIGIYPGSLSGDDAWEYEGIYTMTHNLSDNVVDDAVTVYESVLAAQPDNSVTILCVGFFVNLHALIINNPTGLALVEDKVERLIVQEPLGFGGFNSTHHNLTNLSIEVIDNWPTTVVFSDFGDDCYTGAPLSGTDQDNPVREGWRLECNFCSRPSWDQAAVLYAVRGSENFNTLSSGSKTISSQTWPLTTNPPAKLHASCFRSNSYMADLINDLMIQPPMAGS